MLLVCPQLGCTATRSERRGGVHDHRYGCQSGGSGAALHLLHLTQKVSSPITVADKQVLLTLGLPNECSLPVFNGFIFIFSASSFLFSFFFREYDNLKGSLKSTNDMCEKLKREVISSNNKVTTHHHPEE